MERGEEGLLLHDHRQQFLHHYQTSHSSTTASASYIASDAISHATTHAAAHSATDPTANATPNSPTHAATPAAANISSAATYSSALIGTSRSVQLRDRPTEPMAIRQTGLVLPSPSPWVPMDTAA